MKQLNLSTEDKEIQKIIKEIDYIGNGLINYSEFIAATLSIGQVLTEEQLWSLFKKFDVDNTDYITTANLREAFSRQGRFKINDIEL